MVYLNDKLNLMQPIRFLTGTEMTRIHQSALRILECTGMTIDHVKALEYLRQSGCYVDMVKRHVLFPPAVVEAVVVQMKANFADPNRRPKRMSVRYSQIHFGREPFQVHGDFSVSAGGFCCFIWDLDGKRRQANMEDVKQALKLADRLDQITYTGLPCAAQEVPVAVRPVVMAAAGTLALGIAETLAGLTLGFAVDPRATMTIDVTPGYCDMRSLRFGYAGAERLPLIAARIQLISEFYGCPSGVHGGKTNACVPGIQAGVEKAASMLMPVLAGAIGFGTVGHLENALTFSPLQLVIDNEIARYVRRCVQGIEVSDETLALDVIEQAGIGGHTVDTEHTSRHFKHELLLSPFFDVPSWGVDDAQDKERFEKMALDKARRLLAEETEPILSRGQQEAIDEIVVEAKRDYGC